MYSFQNDYSEGADPNILRALETINYHQNNSYGLDEHCDNARDKIQEALENYGVDIHFITGGTLTNLTFLSHALRQSSVRIPVILIHTKPERLKQADIKYSLFLVPMEN